MSKIVLITSGQPALNPRLVKEADALSASGHTVTVIYAYWNQWGQKFTERLLDQRSWTALCAGGDPRNGKRLYCWSRFLFGLSRLVFRLSGQRWPAEWAIGRSAPFLSRLAARQVADLYIGHNLAALPAAVRAARKNKRPCGFDAEDFHRYEVSSDPRHPDAQLKRIIEDKYLPRLQYLTASSHQIGEAYRQLFPILDPVVVRNVFPKSNLRPAARVAHAAPIKLFWFSQTLGSQRGLNDVVGALAELPRQCFELHLLCDQPPHTRPFRDELLASGVPIQFYNPLPAAEIVDFAAQFDIGLATEPGFSVNNDLALSNKLFTYLQAGLFIVASATTAQRAFMDQYPGVGRWYVPGNITALRQLLLQLDQDRQQLIAGRQAALQLAQTEANWETEQHIFLAAVRKALVKR